MGTMIKTIWQNRRHFKLHVFGFAVFAMIGVFAVNLIAMSVQHNQLVAQANRVRVKLTSNFTMSASGVNGSVENIFVDNTKQNCFILLHFDDISKMTANVNAYHLAMVDVDTKGKQSAIKKENFSAEIYLWGSTGYMGIDLHSDAPFKNHPKLLLLQTNSAVGSSSNNYSDRGKFAFNPGGTSATTIDFYEKFINNQQDLNFSTIYRQIYSVSAEKTARKALIDTYSSLKSSRTSIIEYRNRLISNYNIDVPAIPEIISGDEFETVNLYDAEGEVVGYYTKYNPAVIVPKGMDFNWYIQDINKGYFTAVADKKDQTTIREYLQVLRNDTSETPVVTVSTSTMKYKDGTDIIITEDEASRTTYENAMLRDIELYNNALTAYLDTKTEYQTELLPALLELEQQADLMTAPYTCKSGEGVLKY